MALNAYHDISPGIASRMMSIIPENDVYHSVTHARRLARTLQVLLDQQPTGRLLELGTSCLVPAVLSSLIPELEVTVTDFDLTLPQTGMKYVSIGEFNADFSCYRVDLETQALPCEDETFDYVLCCEVIEHMERDPMFMLSEVNRVLRPGGTLILTTPNVVSSWGITNMLHGTEPYFFLQYNENGNLYRHNYEYSIHSLMRIVRAAGFDGSIWTEDTFKEPNYADVDKLRAIGYPMDHVGDNIFVAVKKTGPVIDRYPSVIYVKESHP